MDKYTYAIGRRKNAVATVRVFEGSAQSEINGKPADEYVTLPTYREKMYSPFVVSETKGRYYFTAKVVGGGTTGQVDAIALGISRALCKIEPMYRPALKKLGLLSRDDRMVERKKTGLKKARKRPQFSKR